MYIIPRSSGATKAADIKVHAGSPFYLWPSYTLYCMNSHIIYCY